MDEAALGFISDMIQQLRSKFQTHWKEAEACIQQNPSLGLMHKSIVEAELQELVGCLRPNAFQLLTACGINEELGGTILWNPHPNPNPQEQRDQDTGTLKIILKEDTLKKAMEAAANKIAGTLIDYIRKNPGPRLFREWAA
jgi:hypothetical protein